MKPAQASRGQLPAPPPTRGGRNLPPPGRSTVCCPGLIDPRKATEQVVRMNRVRHVSELLLGRDRLPFDVEGHNANRSRGWTQYAGDGPQRRGFARTVRSD